jgi:hypothetical protein
MEAPKTLQEAIVYFSNPANCLNLSDGSSHRVERRSYSIQIRSNGVMRHEQRPPQERGVLGMAARKRDHFRQQFQGLSFEPILFAFALTPI